MGKSIKTHIDNFIRFNESNVTNIILGEIDRWETQFDIKKEDINKGDCYIFAENLESLIDGCEILTTDLFYNLANRDEYTEGEDDEIWSKEEDYNSFKPDKLEWPKNGYHGWIYVNGKHYDAEMVEGVVNFYDLPIFKRYIK